MQRNHFTNTEDTSDISEETETNISLTQEDIKSYILRPLHQPIQIQKAS